MTAISSSVLLLFINEDHCLELSDNKSLKIIFFSILINFYNTVVWIITFLFWVSNSSNFCGNGPWRDSQCSYDRHDHYHFSQFSLRSSLDIYLISLVYSYFIVWSTGTFIIWQILFSLSTMIRSSLMGWIMLSFGISKTFIIVWPCNFLPFHRTYY